MTNVYINKKEEKTQSTFIPKGVRKRKTESKVTKRKEVIKVRAEINEIENVKTVEKLTKLRYFKKISKIDKPLVY